MQTLPSGPSLVVVTGAGRGIGRETARMLAASGSTVLAIDLLESVLEAPRGKATGRWHGMVADITSESFAADVVTRLEAVRDAVEHFPHNLHEGRHGARAGGFTLGLVNCAFTEQRASISDGTRDGWQRTMDVNFHAAVELSRSVAAFAMASGHPASFVNVTSVHSGLAHEEFGAYSASKAALRAFTRSASLEWGPHGIRVNALAPGFVAVERNAHVWSDPTKAAGLRACNNLDRLAAPAEIAASIIFLLSPAASFITGAEIPVDGGQTSRLLEVPRS